MQGNATTKKITKKIGVLGGSFNPVHNGHIAIAKHLLAGDFVNEVWFMPCGNPPHKKGLLAFDVRYKMLELAVNGLKNVFVKKYDNYNNEKSYTLNLMKRLNAKYSFYNFYFVIGDDNVFSLPSWYKWRELLLYAKFLVLSRKTENNWQSLDYANALTKVNMPLVDVSSTEIRTRLLNDKSIEDLVPIAILPLIAKYKKDFNE